MSSRILEAKPELWDAIEGSVTWVPWEPEQRGLLEKARNLKVVCTLGVVIDHLDMEYWSNNGIPVGHCPTAVTGATADLAFTLILTAVSGVKRGTEFFVLTTVCDHMYM